MTVSRVTVIYPFGRRIFCPWHLESTGPAERPMTRFQAEQQSSSSQNMAQPRRRDPLSAAPARSELPDPIRRPALVTAGRGHLS